MGTMGRLSWMDFQLSPSRRMKDINAEFRSGEQEGALLFQVFANDACEMAGRDAIHDFLPGLAVVASVLYKYGRKSSDLYMVAGKRTRWRDRAGKAQSR